MPIKDNRKLSRRATLTGLASAPALGLPSVETTAAEDAKLIGLDRELTAIIEAFDTGHYDDLDAVLDRMEVIWIEVAATKAQTMRGLLAKARVIWRDEVDLDLDQSSAHDRMVASIARDLLRGFAVEA